MADESAVGAINRPLQRSFALVEVQRRLLLESMHARHTAFPSAGCRGSEVRTSVLLCGSRRELYFRRVEKKPTPADGEKGNSWSHLILTWSTRRRSRVRPDLDHV